MQIAILGAGDKENIDFISTQLEKVDYTIAVDGGLEAFYELGKVPNLIVGDFDSVDKTILQSFAGKTKIINLPTEKDDSDLEIPTLNDLVGFPESNEDKTFYLSVYQSQRFGGQF